MWAKWDDDVVEVPTRITQQADAPADQVLAYSFGFADDRFVLDDVTVHPLLTVDTYAELLASCWKRHVEAEAWLLTIYYAHCGCLERVFYGYRDAFITGNCQFMFDPGNHVCWNPAHPLWRFGCGGEVGLQQ